MNDPCIATLRIQREQRPRPVRATATGACHAQIDSENGANSNETREREPGDRTISPERLRRSRLLTNLRKRASSPKTYFAKERTKCETL
ncbi:hypothetical protein J6590_019290 [Homalodisca vitripennis]|nr:hypothetical protein J6590_019290 [Homalodisca vitripennis]